MPTAKYVFRALRVLLARREIGRVAARVSEGTWLVLLVLLPAAFNPAGVLAFEPLKTSLLQLAAIIIAVGWLAHRLLGSPTIDVGAHPVVRAGLTLIGLAAVATALSIEPGLSFFGSFDRGMGWLSLAAGGVLLLSAADLFSDECRRERAISALILGSAVPCGYALLQRTGLDPVTWTTLGAPGSSLGSPTFLAGYLVIVAPFALYRVIGRVHSATSGGPGTALGYAGWLALLLIVCAVTVQATIRGPILGLAAGLLAFAVLARPRSGTSRSARGERALHVAGAAALLLVGGAAAVAATGGAGMLGLQRFLKIAQGGDSSVERLTVWQDALRIPLSDPLRILVGFGPETQSAVLERGEATVRLTQNQQWDRAHDLLLDTWLTGGVLGVAILLVVLGCALRSAWQARAHAPGSLLPVAVLAALAGHLVEVSFAFHTVVTGALFWMLLGLAASLTPRRHTHTSVLAAPKGRRPTAWLAATGAVAGLLLLPLVVVPAVADALYGAARRANYEDGAQQEEVAARFAPWVEELPRAAALDWQQVANRRTDPAVRARVAIDLREAAARAPMEPLPQLRLTRFYLVQGDLDAAEQACQRALETGPYRAAVWDACADVSARRGLSTEAPIRRARGEALRQPR